MSSYYVVRKFVHDRLQGMKARPGMWAGTKEGFGLQLALLVDFYQLEREPGSKFPGHIVMRTIFGPGNAIPQEPVEDAWAAAAVDAVVKMLGPAIT